jgi:hypothetical protein
MDVFNCCYELMLRLLLRFYAHTDESAADLGALRYTLFPMMTMVIRPLAEILTQMPAGNGQLAGPSFELAETIQFLPHKKSAWIILVERMQNAAEQCNRQATVEGIPPRLHSVAESLTYMANRFKEAVDTTGTEANAQHQF